MDAFFVWCYKQRQRLDLVKSNPLAKALAYVSEREHQLRVFLNDPDVQPDTNHLERALRVIPMGRKNWLFAWTEIGAEQNRSVSYKACWSPVDCTTSIRISI